MAQIAVQTPGITGVTPARVAGSSGGDFVVNTGRILILFENTNAGARNVTVNSQKLCDQGTDHDVVINVPATTGIKVAGPFPKGRWDDSGGLLQLTYDVNPPTGLVISPFECST